MCILIESLIDYTLRKLGTLFSIPSFL